jgi:hypothetical protein
MLRLFSSHFYDELPDCVTTSPFLKFMKRVEFICFLIVMQKGAEDDIYIEEG